MRTSNLTTASLGALFARYVSLATFSMLGYSLYILADTFFIANSAGSAGLVALNLSLPIYSTISGIGLMLGVGGATLFSARRGEMLALGRACRPECNFIFTRVLVLGIAIGLVLTALGLLCPVPLARMLGAKGEIIPLASAYLGTILSFSVAFICNNILVSFVRNDGGPHVAMAAIMVGSAINIVLDYVFLFPLNMGLFGAALATGLAPVAGVLVCSLHFRGKKANFGLARIQFTTRGLWRSLSGGISSFLAELSSGAVIFVFNTVLLSIANETAVAAYGVIANVSLVCMSVFSGIGQGLQPIISQNHGAGHVRRVNKALTMALCTAVFAGMLLYTLGLLFPHAIAAAFNKSGDALLASYTVQGIPLYFSAFLLMGVNIVLASYFSSTLCGGLAFFISITRGFVAMIPAVLLLSSLFGVTGVWLAVPVAETIACVLGLALLRRTRRISKSTPQRLDEIP